MNKKANEIIIKTKKRLFGANIGNNISVFKGNGLDFRELKEYSFGDDVKKINWKVTAKTQKPFVNVFNEERELNIVAVFALSANIYFGSIKQKQELMSEILALIGYSAISNSDNFSAIFFDSDARKIYKPTKSNKMLYPIISDALSFEVAQKKVDYKALESFLLGFLKQKSIVFLIGDFFEDIDISYLAAKCEVYAIIARDRFEENPKFSGEIELIDPSDNKSYKLNINENILDNFKNEIKKKDTKLKEHFLKNGVNFVKVYTDEEPFSKLITLFRT
jgi:uncharacterized protein (DUF58 family)